MERVITFIKKFIQNQTKDDGSYPLLIKKLMKSIKIIHYHHPHAIIIAQKTAGPYEGLITEAYKAAWPKEEPPRILKIDIQKHHKIPKKDISNSDYWKKTPHLFSLVEDVKKKIKKTNNGKIFVVDENSKEGTDLFNPETTIGLASYIVKKASEQLGKTHHVIPHNISQIPIKNDKHYQIQDIEFYKAVGKVVGKQIKIENDKKKRDFEGIIGVIIILGIGILLFSQNITGLAVANVDSGHDGNALLFLIVIVLVGLFLWTRNK
ncbi:MAG: hypothetical protein AABW49_00130 [Nanoarchaeota archaeon]